MIRNLEDGTIVNLIVIYDCEESKQNFQWLYQVLTAHLDEWVIERDSTEIFSLRTWLSKGMPFVNVYGKFSYCINSERYTLPDSVAEYALSLLACYASASLGERDKDYHTRVNTIKNYLLENLSPQDSKILTEFMMNFVDKKSE